ncbi:unnamed protein product [Caenorhabditis brenneri]
MSFGYILLVLCAILFFGNAVNGHPKIKSCPKGWLQFEKTCYFRQPDILNFEDASKSCERRESKLFDYDDAFEFEAIRKLFPNYYYTWIRANVEEELEWLYEPYEEKINGKNSVATCIAFYSSPTRSYSYYHPCSALFHSICKKSLDTFHQWMD